MSTYIIILRFAKKSTVYLSTFILLSRMAMRFESQRQVRCGGACQSFQNLGNYDRRNKCLRPNWAWAIQQVMREREKRGGREKGWGETDEMGKDKL